MKEKQIFHMHNMNIQIRSVRNNSKKACNNFLLFGLLSPNKKFFIHTLKSSMELKACSTGLGLTYHWSLENGFNKPQRKFYC